MIRRMTPEETVRTFLQAFEAGDIDRAVELLDDDVVWINVSLPEIHGRRRIEKLSRKWLDRGLTFRVHFHHVAADGDVVLTERTDEIGIGKVAQRFWVHGRFEVRDGRITVWRDAFDWGDMVVSLGRGLAGALAPSLNRPWPGRH